MSERKVITELNKEKLIEFNTIDLICEILRRKNTNIHLRENNLMNNRGYYDVFFSHLDFHEMYRLHEYLFELMGKCDDRRNEDFKHMNDLNKEKKEENNH